MSGKPCAYSYPNQKAQKTASAARGRLKRRILDGLGASRRKGFKPKLITLTYGKHMTDKVQAGRDLENFIRRMRANNGGKLAYTAIREYHKSGSIHFHIITYNQKYMKKSEVAKRWGKGFVDIRQIKDRNKNQGGHGDKGGGDKAVAYYFSGKLTGRYADGVCDWNRVSDYVTKNLSGPKTDQNYREQFGGDFNRWQHAFHSSKDILQFIQN